MEIEKFYDDIRPYSDSEVSEVLARLLRDIDLLNFLGRWRYPILFKLSQRLARIPIGVSLKRRFGQIRSVRGFQDVVYNYVTRIIEETTSNFEYSGIENLDPKKAYLFVSNHRDIAGDSMLLDYALYTSGLDTVRIAVGDNLVQVGFATDLMKLNKSFIIKRSEEGAKKVYSALLKSSQYIHDSLSEGQSIWIAQSEGRAKDGMDLTEPAIIKMFTLAKRKQNFAESIRELNIVPMAISYEYDPCDVHKALELATIANEGTYTKPDGEDLANLVRGLVGFKGRVALKIGKPLTSDFLSADDVAREIDRQIKENLVLFSINHWALSQLEGDKKPVDDHFSSYFSERLSVCPEKARPYFLRMYANPVKNKAQV